MIALRKCHRSRKKAVLSIAIAGVCAAGVLLYGTATLKNQDNADIATAAPSLTPWSSVGGCGAGGSGGGGGGAKWVGMGVSGGLIDIELMNSLTIGQNFRDHTLKTRLSWKPTYTTSMGLSIPIVSKVGNHQSQSNRDPRTEVTGGLGDISIDWSSSFGMSGEYSLNVAAGLPTGQYDIRRGKENEKEYLSTSLQKGTGLVSPSVGLGYSLDVMDGIWLFDLTYAHPMAVNVFGKNQFITTEESDRYKGLADDWDDMTDEQRSRFEYFFKPYGENDLGAYSPPSVSLSAYFGYRGIEHYVHSFGMTFSAPLAVAWVHGFTASGYDPFPDPDHKAWTATLNYGLEFSRHEYPIFMAVSLPINDQTNEPNKSDKYDPEPFRKWDLPAWGDIGQSWTLSIGMKSTMF